MTSSSSRPSAALIALTGALAATVALAAPESLAAAPGSDAQAPPSRAVVYEGPTGGLVGAQDASLVFVDDDGWLARVPKAGGEATRLASLGFVVDELLAGDEAVFAVVGGDGDDAGVHRIGRDGAAARIVPGASLQHLALTPTALVTVAADGAATRLERRPRGGGDPTQTVALPDTGWLVAAIGETAYVLSPSGELAAVGPGQPATPRSIASLPCHEAHDLVASGSTLAVACATEATVVTLDLAATAPHPVVALTREPQVVALAGDGSGDVVFVTGLIGRVGIVGAGGGRYLLGASGAWRDVAIDRDDIYLASPEGLARVARRPPTEFVPTALGAACSADFECVSSAACLDHRCADIDDARLEELALAISRAESAPTTKALEAALAADAEARAERRSSLRGATYVYRGPDVALTDRAKPLVARLEAVLRDHPDLVDEEARGALQEAALGTVELPRVRDAIDRALELGDRLADELLADPATATARAGAIRAAHAAELTAVSRALGALEKSLASNPSAVIELRAQHAPRLDALAGRWAEARAHAADGLTAPPVLALDVGASAIATAAPTFYVNPFLRDATRGDLDAPLAQADARRPAALLADLLLARDEGRAWRREFYVLAGGALALEAFPGDPPLPLPRVVTWQATTEPWGALILEAGAPSKLPASAAVTLLDASGRLVTPPGHRPAAAKAAAEALRVELTRPAGPAFRGGWAVVSDDATGIAVDAPADAVVTHKAGGGLSVLLEGDCPVSITARPTAVPPAQAIEGLLRAGAWGDGMHLESSRAITFGGRPGLTLKIASSSSAANLWVAFGPRAYVSVSVLDRPACGAVLDRIVGSIRLVEPPPEP